MIVERRVINAIDFGIYLPRNLLVNIRYRSPFVVDFQLGIMPMPYTLTAVRYTPFT